MGRLQGADFTSDHPWWDPLYSWIPPPPLVETRDAARDAANGAFERDFDWIIDDPVEARQLIERVRARLNNKLYCYIIFHVLSIKACNLLGKTFI